MNNKLEKRIAKLELQKSKELDKISLINENIAEIEEQLKPLYDYKKKKKKIVKMQQELEMKIEEELK